MTIRPYRPEWREAVMAFLRTRESARATEIAEAIKVNQKSLSYCFQGMLDRKVIVRLSRGRYAIHPCLRKETA